MTPRRLLLVGLFLLGAVPMVGHLWTRGALWADEAALALNIGPRALLEMGRPFVFYQACPWGTMALVKASVTLFGATERAYRLVPLLAALAGLGASAAVAHRAAAHVWGSRAAAAAGFTALGIVAASADVVYYAAELKPYTMDLFVTAGLLWLFLRAIEGPAPTRADWARLGAAGVVAGWLSLPSIFVTGALTAALAWHGRRAGWGRARLLAVVGLGALWLASFGAHFSAIIAPSDLATKPVVRTYWRGGFAPFPPSSIADLRWYAGKFLYVFEAPLDVGVPALGAAAFVFGLWLIARRRPALAIALAGPWALALVASMLGRYPPEGRLALFLIPALTAVLAATLGRGLSDDRAPVRAAAGLTLALLLLPGLSRVAEHTTPGPEPDMRALLAHLAQAHRDGEPVFLSDWDFEQIWQHYAAPLDLPSGVHFRLRWLRRRDEAGRFPELDALAARTFGQPRVWIIAHDTPPGYAPNAPDRSETPMATFLDRFFLRHGGRAEGGRAFGDLHLRSYDLRDAAR